MGEARSDEALEVQDCRSEEGVIVGLIDGVIAQSRVVARYLRDHLTPHVTIREALADLRADEDVALLSELAAARADNEAKAQRWEAEEQEWRDTAFDAIGYIREHRERADRAEAALADARRALGEVRDVVRDWADEDASPDADRVKLVTLPTRIWAIVSRVSSPSPAGTQNQG